jgi:hypothetical protein
VAGFYNAEALRFRDDAHRFAEESQGVEACLDDFLFREAEGCAVLVDALVQ